MAGAERSVPGRERVRIPARCALPHGHQVKGRILNNSRSLSSWKAPGFCVYFGPPRTDGSANVVLITASRPGAQT